ncbi:MAG: hypothetical protein WDN28_03205 [Chthoniobacter sp.]
MKLPSVVTTLLSASLLFVATSGEANDPPTFPGQPHINSALKHLTSAREKAPTDAPGALGELAAASGELARASKNKGTYKNIARQLTDQATQYLQKGEPDKAVHKIDEAIANTNRAGETGDH